MIKIKKHIALSFITLLLLCSFSMDVSYYGDYSSTPILMTRSDFEQAIATLPAKELNKTTRISIKDTMIYIVELYRGVHIIDNSDVTSPFVTSFINIPGCVDMAIKGDVLYARSAVDLVAIDISDISNVKQINRVKETFPELELNDEYYDLPYRFQEGQRPDSTVIVGWQTKEN